MKLLLTLSLVLSFTLSLHAQEGVVNYTRKTFWIKISSRMTYLSQEQKDRIANTNKNYGTDGFKEKMKLVFSPTASLYSYESETSESEDGRWSWRNSDLFLYRNFEKERVTDVMEMLGKTHLVEDSLQVPVWRIGNQVREIAGHMCLNATTTDSTKGQTITAWFAQDIPVQAGPERYFGLPGLILELDINGGDVIVEATSVTMQPVAELLNVPKVKKPKRLDEKGYQLLLKNYIAEQMKEQQNPYWEIRY
jgi:GLPGLI family protein